MEIRDPGLQEAECAVALRDECEHGGHRRWVDYLPVSLAQRRRARMAG